MSTLLSWLWPAIVAGILLAAIAAPLGSLLVWRGMAFFADSLAHGSLLGISLALLTGISPWFGLLGCALLFVIFLHFFQRRRDLSGDTVLGIISQSSLAFSLLLVYLIKPTGLRVEAFLLGDLLAVGAQEALLIGLVAIVALVVCIAFWQQWVLGAIDAQLARTESTHYNLGQGLFLFSLAAIVAVAIPLVGALLVSALFILPAATARALATSPTALAWLAALVGVFSIVGGIGVAWWMDVPAGPAIVCTNALCFFLSRLRQSAVI